MTADDHALLRAGIAATVANEPDITVVAEAKDGAEAIALYEEHRPDVVLMDLRMPKLDGAEATRAIMTAHPDALIVALTAFDGDADIFRALSAGACGYLVKGVLGDALVSAIRDAAARKKVIPLAVAQTLAEFTPRVDLTDREVEILRLV